VGSGACAGCAGCAVAAPHAPVTAGCSTSDALGFSGTPAPRAWLTIFSFRFPAAAEGSAGVWMLAAGEGCCADCWAGLGALWVAAAPGTAAKGFRHESVCASSPLVLVATCAWAPGVKGLACAAPGVKGLACAAPGVKGLAVASIVRDLSD